MLHYVSLPEGMEFEMGFVMAFYGLFSMDLNWFYMKPATGGINCAFFGGKLNAINLQFWGMMVHIPPPKKMVIWGDGFWQWVCHVSFNVVKIQGKPIHHFY